MKIVFIAGLGRDNAANTKRLALKVDAMYLRRTVPTTCGTAGPCSAHVELESMVPTCALDRMFPRKLQAISCRSANHPRDRMALCPTSVQRLGGAVAA